MPAVSISVANAMGSGNTYIYGLIDPRNGHVKYIGKANNVKKRYNEHIKYHVNSEKTKKNNWIKFLIKNDMPPILEIIDTVSISEWEFWEKHYISLFKSWGFDLVNGTMGGDGCKVPYTNERREKISKIFKGRVLSEEHKNKLRKLRIGCVPWNKGKKGCYTESQLKNMIESHKGQKAWNKGVSPTIEQKEKMSISAKKRKPTFLGKTHSKESKMKMSLAKKGKPSPFKNMKNRFSPETKEKMRKSKINFYAKRSNI